MKSLLLALTLLLSATQVFAQTAPDMIPMDSVQIVNAPAVQAWPITTAITQVSFDGSVTRVNFTKKDGPGRWPDVTPAGWEGPLEYTIWLFVNNGGQWVGSGFIQMWNGRDGSGSAADPDVPSLYSKNWYYSARWTPIFGHGPIKAGETIGFMVTSGNQRDNVGPNSVQERSNIVTFAATDDGVFNFPTGPTPPAETCQDPKANNEGKPLPCTYDPPVPPSDLQAQIDALKASVAALTSRVSTDEGVANEAIATFNTRIAALEARPVVTSCRASVFGIAVSCSVQ